MFIVLLTFFSRLPAQTNFIGSGIALQCSGGVGNGIDLGDVFNNLTFPFAIEAWINLQSYPDVAAGIFGTDNDLQTYSGVYLSCNPDGTVIMELGDGMASGTQDRRGYRTTTPLPLHKWVHLAATCDSVTGMHFYFNGIDQPQTNTSGQSSSTVMLHSNAGCSIGRTMCEWGEYDLDGMLDEVRLWSVHRSETDVRNNMCKKGDPSSPGLEGYWSADESYISPGINDLTTPAENGLIVGTIYKITSSAPVGNESDYLYTSGWTGTTISIGASTGDSLSVENISGSPHGIQLYRVDSIPYFTVGLINYPHYYFGVFVVENDSISHYTASYDYSFQNGIASPANQNFLQLMKRTDNSVTYWLDATALQDTTINQLQKENEFSRSEYVLNSPVATGISSISEPGILIYPIPAAASVIISAGNQKGKISSVHIADLGGRLLKEINNVAPTSRIYIDISDLKNGIYLIEAITASGIVWSKLDVQR